MSDCASNLNVDISNISFIVCNNSLDQGKSSLVQFSVLVDDEDDDETPFALLCDFDIIIALNIFFLRSSSYIHSLVSHSAYTMQGSTLPNTTPPILIHNHNAPHSPHLHTSVCLARSTSISWAILVSSSSTLMSSAFASSSKF